MSTSRARRRPAAAAQPRAKRPVIFTLAIVLVGVCVFSNSLGGPFVWDDETAVVSNRTVQKLWPLSGPLRPPRETPAAGRPLVNLSFAINYAMGGLNETGYHVFNIAAHIACTLLLFGVVRRTLASPTLHRRFGRSADLTAAVAALLWMVHPLQSEVVDYITQRTESIMALCFLATLYCAIRARAGATVRMQPDTTTATTQTAAAVRLKPDTTGDMTYRSGGSASATKWTVLSVIACAAGMAAKESMLTAPLIVLLYDRVFEFRSWRQTIQERKYLYAGLAVTWIELAAFVWQQPRSTAGLSSAVSPWVYALNQTQMIVRYLWLAVWPGPLVLDYGLPRAISFRDVIPETLAVLSLLIAAGVASVKWPQIGWLATTFLITLAPTSSVIPIASEVGAERRMYLPCAALAVLVVVSGRLLIDRSADGPHGSRLRGGVVALTVLALIACAVRTFYRNAEYATALSLWRTVVERRPQGRARMALATELIASGNREEALAQLRRAVTDYPDARFGLGTELIADGKTEEGIAELRQFVDANPSNLNRIPARTLLGQALAAQGKLAESADQFQAVLRIVPKNTHVRSNLADVLFSQQQYEAAAVEYRALLAEQPNNATLQSKLAADLLGSGRTDEALAHFRKALEIDPQSAPVNRYLAEIYLRRNDVERGKAHAGEAVRLDPRDGAARNLLGVALASAGNFNDAVAQFKEALQINPNDPQSRANLERALRAIRDPGSRIRDPRPGFSNKPES
jgi:protein O-mannosyl-transferase